MTERVNPLDVSAMSERQPSAPEQSFARLTPRDPRTRAALCYAIPIVPALYMLWRERRGAFIRLHAAQSVVFFCGLALTQTLLFVALVALGNWAPAGGWLTALGLLFWALFAALGLGGFALWLRLLNDCAHGRLRRRPLLTPLAARLHVTTLHFARAASAAYHQRRNGSQNETLR